MSGIQVPDKVPGLSLTGSLEEITRDWAIMYTFITCEALSTHYEDGTPLSPRQRAYARVVLDSLKSKLATPFPQEFAL